MTPRVGLGLGAAALLLSAASCSDWPPSSKGDGSGASSASVSDGTCSGTPPGCGSLNTAQCAATLGCSDDGTCGGSGVTCGTERSPELCNASEGCFWSSVCTGTPLGCSLNRDQSACRSVPGCTWTPDGDTSSGGAGGGVTCSSFNAPCSSAAQCDCAFSCVQLCASCTSVCARSCRTDADCADAVGDGTPTPTCVKGSGGATGACAVR